MHQSQLTQRLLATLGLALLVSVTSAAATAAETPGTTRLTIATGGFRNDNGQAGIAVFRSAAGFPSDRSKAAVGKVLPIRGGKVRLTVDLPPGRYAVLVLHDENANGKMDTNFLGIPTEGYGVSRDARRTFGPPVFDEAAFPVKGERQAVSIRVKY